MYVNWKALFSLGFAFWGLLCCTDLLGESTWKRCSSHLDDILKGQYNELSKMHQEKTSENTDSLKQKLNWPILLWNVCAFLCSLVFCSVIRSMSWVLWKLFKIYNVFRNRKALTKQLTNSSKNSDGDIQETVTENKRNCEVIFKNQMFTALKPSDNMKNQELIKELDEIRKEKQEITQQLNMAQEENLTARQQIEEYRLETFMLQEKLARTSNSLKENLKYKDFANANQEMITRKAHSLEVHLQDVSRDREILRNKLGCLEKNYLKLEERLKIFEKPDSETNDVEQYPEKDTTNNPSVNEVFNKLESEIIESTADDNICKFQKKIMALQRNIGDFVPKKVSFEANSKISVDLDESSKENDSEILVEGINVSKKSDIDILKQNILNYNAYKTQMMRPKMIKLNNIKESLYTHADTTGSSSDENNGCPHRMISSTAEFQNFLKTLSTTSGSSVNFKRSFF